MACITGGEVGWWRILVATRDGRLLSVDYPMVMLVASDSDGPYR